MKTIFAIGDSVISCEKEIYNANVLSLRRNSPVDCYSKKKPPTFVGGLCSRYLSSRAVARQVLSAYMSLTSVFGMGTGGPS